MGQAGDLILKEDKLKLTPSGPPCSFVGPPHISMRPRPRKRGCGAAGPQSQTRAPFVPYATAEWCLSAGRGRSPPSLCSSLLPKTLLPRSKVVTFRGAGI